jgi:pyridoxal phosphate enzyme (YggS family)
MSEASLNSDISKNLKAVNEAIAKAANESKRRASEITLIAVSKKKPASDVLEAVAAGQLVFGENYVQEALQKIDLVTAEIKASIEQSKVRFDLIGPLQSNKAKLAVGVFELIHTVDRPSIAEAISKIAVTKNIVQKVLIQVNISGEETKSGIKVDEVFDFASSVIKLPGIEVRGLMSIGSYFSEDASEQVRMSEFVKMAELKTDLENRLSIVLPELSMGMSDDYSLAIRAGATIVRVGSAIFGARI